VGTGPVESEARLDRCFLFQGRSLLIAIEFVMELHHVPFFDVVNIDSHHPTALGPKSELGAFIEKHVPGAWAEYQLPMNEKQAFSARECLLFK
jgi:hypothetical protein